jgi:hypothetical protein
MFNACKATGYFAVIIGVLCLVFSSRPLVSDKSFDKLAMAIFSEFSTASRAVCAGGGHNSKIDLDSLALTVAIADVESYVRPAWRRFLQRNYLMINYYISKTIKDVSVGPSQIKISNVLGILHQNTSNELLFWATDDCVNLSVAYCFVHKLRIDVSGTLGGSSMTYDELTTVARLYNGQSDSALRESSLQYIELVRRLFAITRSHLNEILMPDGLKQVNQRHICL